MDYCDNTLTVHGHILSLEKFFIENKDDKRDLSFARSVPLSRALPPQKTALFEQLDGKKFDKEALENWGCGWDCDDVQVDKQNDVYIYHFDTPKFSPIQWLEKTSIIYPDLEFELESQEIFQDYFLETKIKNGQRIFFDQSSLKEKTQDVSGNIDIMNNLLTTIKNTTELMNNCMNGLKGLSFDDLSIHDDEPSDNEEVTEDLVQFMKILQNQFNISK